MAEPQVIEQPGAEVSDGAGDELTPEQALEARFEELRTANASLLQNQTFLMNELRGIQGRADSAHSAIEALQTHLQEQYAPKKAERLLEETIKSFDNGAAIWERYQRDGEIEALRAKVDAKPAPAEPKQPDPAAAELQVLQTEFGPVRARIRREYGRLGVPFEVFEQAWKSDDVKRGRGTAEDPRGWLTFEDDAMKLGREWKAKVTAQGKERVNIDTSRGTGTGSMSYDDAQKKKWDTSKKGIDESLAEYDKLIAAAQK